jgi:hypothetical protein
MILENPDAAGIEAHKRNPFCGAVLISYGTRSVQLGDPDVLVCEACEKAWRKYWRSVRKSRIGIL